MLWNVDKHRLLHVMTLGGELSELEVASRESDTGLREVKFLNRLPAHGDEVLRFTPVGPRLALATFHIHGSAKPHIRFDESVPDWVRKTDVMDVIIRLGQEVQRTLNVLQDFAL